MCEADDRNKQALFVLDNEWGSGRIDIAQLRSILRGTGDHSDCEDMTHARTG